MSGGHSDEYSFSCVYSGQPENNVRWVQVDQIFGVNWHGKTVNDLNKAFNDCSARYEFIRGNIPKTHQYGTTQRQFRALYDTYMKTELMQVGKFKGRTLEYVYKKDSQYFDWALGANLIESFDDFKYRLQQEEEKVLYP